MCLILNVGSGVDESHALLMLSDYEAHGEEVVQIQLQDLVPQDIPKSLVKPEFLCLTSPSLGDTWNYLISSEIKASFYQLKNARY